MPLFRILILALAIGALLGSPARAQSIPAINKETVEQLGAQIRILREQIAKSGAFIAEAEPKILDLERTAQNAPADVDQMIADLEALVERFKAGSETSSAIQRAMEDIRSYIDKYREGSEAQQRAAESLRNSLAGIEASDAERDRLVGQALAAIRQLKAQKDDLVALQIAQAYQDMSVLYGQMVGSFRDTVAQADTVVDSIEQSTGVPAQ